MRITLLSVFLLFSQLFSQSTPNQILELPFDTSQYVGMFTTHTPVPIGTSRVNSVLWGDADSDGLEEWYGAFVVGGGHQVRCFEQDTSGAFQQAKSYNVSSYEVFDLKDIDNDGLTELILQRDGYHGLIVLEPDATGLPANVQLDAVLGDVMVTFHTHHGFSDLDRDGRPDMLTGKGNDGDSTTKFIEYNPGTNQLELTVVDTAKIWMFDYGDLDGDGELEAVGSSIPDREIRVYENIGDNDFVCSWSDKIPEKDSLQNTEYTIVTNDIDNNGKNEFLVWGEGSSSSLPYFAVYGLWYEYNGTGYERVYTLAYLWNYPERIYHFDITGDGKDEIFLLDYGGNGNTLVALEFDEMFNIKYLHHVSPDFEMNSISRYRNHGMLVSIINAFYPLGIRTIRFENNFVPTGIEEGKIEPTNHVLYPCYPNPFNPLTTITFLLPKDAHVRLTVYNTIGQLVDNIINEERKAGMNHVTFDASYLPSGIYYYRIEAEGFSETRRMVLMR